MSDKDTSDSSRAADSVAESISLKKKHLSRYSSGNYAANMLHIGKIMQFNFGL